MRQRLTLLTATKDGKTASVKLSAEQALSEAREALKRPDFKSVVIQTVGREIPPDHQLRFLFWKPAAKKPHAIGRAIR